MGPAHETTMDNKIGKHLFRFDGENYNNWKYRMNILLGEKGLLEYVEDDLEVITLHSNDHEYRQHIKNDKKCMSLLIKHIDDDQLEHVKDKFTSKDIYDALEQIFERKSISGQIVLRRKLLTLKYDGKEHIKHHILKFETTLRELKSIGAKPEKLDIICQLLMTLPPSFDSLVTAIETINPEMLTIDYVKSRLIDEYDKRSVEGSIGNKSSYEMNTHAMSAFRYKCFNCGKSGHKRWECPAEFKSNHESGNKYQTSCKCNSRAANVAEQNVEYDVGL